MIDTWVMLQATDHRRCRQVPEPGSPRRTVPQVLSTDAIEKANQKAPNGFDWSQLLADFDSMGGDETPLLLAGRSRPQQQALRPRSTWKLLR